MNITKKGKVFELDFDDHDNSFEDNPSEYTKEEQDIIGILENNDEVYDLISEDKIRVGYPDGSDGHYFIPEKYFNKYFKDSVKSFSNNDVKRHMFTLAKIKSHCKTKSQRLAFNRLVRSLSI